jgi:hypothetical protein
LALRKKQGKISTTIKLNLYCCANTQQPSSCNNTNPISIFRETKKAKEETEKPAEASKQAEEPVMSEPVQDKQ